MSIANLWWAWHLHSLKGNVVQSEYMQIFSMIERLHRRFLDVVKNELDRLGVADINNVQSLILFNVAEEELTVGELTIRGFYLGSNVSYNLKKMVENGYLVQERSTHDRRSVRVRCSEKGIALCKTLQNIFDTHVAALGKGYVTGEDLEATNKTLKRLERFWTDALRFSADVSLDDAPVRRVAS